MINLNNNQKIMAEIVLFCKAQFVLFVQYAGWSPDMIPTGNLSIEIDFGSNWPRAILQRKEKGYWHDYLVDGRPVVNPFDVEMLPPGYYRLRDPA